MNIIFTDLQYKIPIAKKKINHALTQSANTLKLKFSELSIVFVGERRMRSLNNKFLGHDYVTDVITFKHGEIIVCPLVALKQAKRFNKTVHEEILLYCIHGLLHLAGFDDHAPNDIKRMRQMEIKLLSRC